VTQYNYFILYQALINTTLAFIQSSFVRQLDSGLCYFVQTLVYVISSTLHDTRDTRDVLVDYDCTFIGLFLYKREKQS